MWARRNQTPRRGVSKQELLLVIAFLALLFQVFPTLWFGTLNVIDVRNWGAASWMVLNLAAVIALFAMRLAPEIIAQHWQRRSKRRATNNDDKVEVKHVERKNVWQEMTAKEQSELFRRMQEARKKQVL